jgi:hypothetical protein
MVDRRLPRAATFLLPVAITFPRMGKVLAVAEQTPSLAGELKEKLHTLLALYDGSYFYRLINVGGLFNKMYDQPVALYVSLWLVLAFAVVAVAGFVRGKNRLRAMGFLLSSLILTTIGVLLLPGLFEFIMPSWLFLYRSWLS